MLQDSSNRLYTYSGTDVRAYGYFEGFGSNIVLLDSLQTISYSIHEAKGDARALGFKNVKGRARGIRVVAGSLIMAVIKDNPFAPMMDLLGKVETSPFIDRAGWSFDRDINGIGTAIDSTQFKRRFASAMPPFNILLQYAAEANNWRYSKVQVPKVENDPEQGNILETSILVDGAAVLIKGIDIIDEGMVTSVNDSYSEVTYSFKAFDCKPISIQEFKSQVQYTELPELDPAWTQDVELYNAIYAMQVKSPNNSQFAFTTPISDDDRRSGGRV